MTEHVGGNHAFMGFEPHGQCFMLQPGLIALHAISDFVTGVSYLCIPIAIINFIKRRKDLPFPWTFILFALFIVACGITHLMSIWNVWHAEYWLEGYVKLVTALVSVTTAALLIPLMPKYLVIPRPALLTAANRKLEEEIAVRCETELELELEAYRDHLEVLVAERASSRREANVRLEVEVGERKQTESRLEKAQNSITIILDSMPSVLVGVDSQDVMISPLVCNGVEGAVVRVDDVTQRVHIEEMMVQSEKMMSVGGLAAGMAHEINNPLSAILQGAQVVLAHFSPDMEANRAIAEECGSTMEAIRCYLEKRKVFRFLEGIREAGSRAARIVSNMLEFSRKSESQRIPTNINAIVGKSMELALSDYDLKKKYYFSQIRIEVQSEPGKGARFTLALPLK